MVCNWGLCPFGSTLLWNLNKRIDNNEKYSRDSPELFCVRIIWDTGWCWAILIKLTSNTRRPVERHFNFLFHYLELSIISYLFWIPFQTVPYRLFSGSLQSLHFISPAPLYFDKCANGSFIIGPLVWISNAHTIRTNIFHRNKRSAGASCVSTNIYIESFTSSCSHLVKSAFRSPQQ